MKLFAYLSLALLVGTIVAGCKDLIEEDIENKTIVIKAPTNNLASIVYAQQFWWEEMDGASQYRLEIVSPRFDSLVSILMDTVTEATKLTKTLNPGSYQWRIRGENGSYQSKFQVYNLTILASSLDKQSVIRTSPLNNVYQKNETITFTWNEVYGATSYMISIYTSAGVLVKDTSVTQTEYSHNFNAEGDYKWRIYAKNATEQTPTTTDWNTGYYSSVPTAPTLNEPSGTDAQINPVVFSWSSVSRAKHYTLYINDGETNGPITKHENIEGTNKVVNFPSSASKTQYWSVSCIDKAGNEGSRSLPQNLLFNKDAE